jgi:ribosomal protein S18 acetylase RimI-like enzyme
MILVPPSTPDIQVRALEARDAVAVASIRQRSVARGYLLELGRPVFERFVRAAANDPSTYGFVAEHRGGPVGYVINTTDARRLEALALRSGGTLLRVGWLALRRPAFLRLLASRLGQLVRSVVHRAGSSPARSRAQLRLLDIAVDPGSQGLGIGTLLVDHSLRKARALGHATIGLGVRRDNRAALRLYRSAGFVQDEADDRETIMMSRRLDG